MKHLTHILLTTAASVFITGNTFATDTGLYPEAPPDDASFVRFIGFEGQQSATFAGKAFDLKEDEHGTYIPVSSVKLNDIEAGTYATVLRGADGQIETVAEGPRSNTAKVFLFLVNGTEKVLELKLADGSVAVIENVPSAQSGQRDVNPVAIELGVFTKGQPEPLKTFDVALRRGQNISFIADDRGVRMIENRFGAVAD